MDWTAISGVVAIVQTIVVVIAVIYGIQQLKEAQKARSIDTFFPLFQELNSSQSVSLRRRLYTEIPNDPGNYSADQEEVVNTIVNQLDFLGFLTENGLIDIKLVAPLYYGTVIRCWENAYPYIQHQRTLRSTEFAHYFEILDGKCKKYVQSHRKDEKIQTYRRTENEGKTE